jgi:hypothetical protein
MNLDEMRSRIRSKVGHCIDDYLFGEVERPLSMGRDWLAHLVDYSTASARDRQLSLTQAAALVLVTLQSAPRGLDIYKDSIVEFQHRLLDSLEGRIPDESIMGVAGELVESLRDHMYLVAPPLRVLGDEASISLLLDIYRRYSHLRKGDELAAALETVQGVGTMAVLLGADQKLESQIANLADVRRAKVDAAEALHYLADAVAGLGLNLERGSIPRPRDAAVLASTVSHAVSEFAPGAKPGVAERLYRGRDLIQIGMAKRPALTLVP